MLLHLKGQAEPGTALHHACTSLIPPHTHPALWCHSRCKPQPHGAARLPCSGTARATPPSSWKLQRAGRHTRRAAPRRGRCAVTLAAAVQPPTGGGGSERYAYGEGPAARAYDMEVAAFGYASEEAFDAWMAELDQQMAEVDADIAGFPSQLEASDPEAAARLAAPVPTSEANGTAQPPALSPSSPPAAAWPPPPADMVPAAACARSAAAAAAAAPAVAFASAAAGHEAAAEAAQAAAASQPATAMARAGEEWMRAAAAWRSAYDALAVARQAQPGLAAVVEAEAALQAAEQFKRQRRDVCS